MVHLTSITRDPKAVAAEVQEVYERLFPGGEKSFVTRVFAWAEDCFAGRYGDYQPIDARYHDFEHTLQGTLCLSRLLRGRYVSGALPVLSERTFQLCLLAILLHDSGYLKKRADAGGTGAKYTLVHVDRSADFAGRLMGERGFQPSEIKAVQNMIQCTGTEPPVTCIPFQKVEEQVAGFALGTADLLGQMAADDYVEKLPVLYAEFTEAAEFSHNNRHFIAGFSSAEDLMARTPAFWEKLVLPKLEVDFLGLYQFLNHPYPDGPNSYVERVEANIARLRQMQKRGV